MMAFRECFSRIGELRSLVPDITPILSLTATATQKTMEMVKSVLSLKSDNYTVTVSPNRANIYLYKAKVNNSLGTPFGWLIDMLKSERVLCPKVIVYCKAVKDCGKLFNFFKDSLQELVYVHGKEHVAENMIIGMFHHNTLDKYKERIINSFYVPDGVCRVAFATNALGMCINFADVRYVVHYGPARSVEDFVQEIGRAGRDGKSSTSVLLYQGKHLRRCERKVKEYAKSNTCLRSILLSEFGVSKPDNITAHDCCLACHQKCCCVEDDSLCNKDVPLLLHELHTQGIKSVNPAKKRNVGKNDLC
jgi:ATP-dependent DNA helicase RecQ